MRKQTCHTRIEKVSHDKKQAILLTDAKNEFENLNRKLALGEIQRTCPYIFNAKYNSYALPSSLFVNGTKLLSKEGTTQGDPMAMVMYEIGTLPLKEQLSEE